jgi:uncharacterized hydrophobic protein (TIGR00271 family)
MRSLPREQVRAFIAQMEVEASPRPVFFALLGLAATIATFGLLANSAAVIIGAMLVAPLMSAITGMALAVVARRRGLMRRAVTSVVAGTLLVWACALLLSWISPITEPGSELLSRTRPTAFDLWIALASGLAGAYSLLRLRGSPVLPGVAIATALVPPLATCGIMVRLGNPGAAGGAGLLFLSNLVAITIGGIAVFAAHGLGGTQGAGRRALLRAAAWWGTAFVVILAVLSGSLAEVVQEHRQERILRSTLQAQLRMVPGAVLQEVQRRRAGPVLEVTATVATPVTVDPPIVAAAERLLVRRLSSPVRLVIRSVITRDVDSTGYRRYTSDRPEQHSVEAQEAVRQLLEVQAAALPVEALESFRVTRKSGGAYRVEVRFRGTRPLDDLLRRGLQNLLAEALGAPVELDVQLRPPAASPGEPPALRGVLETEPAGTRAAPPRIE